MLIFDCFLSCLIAFCLRLCWLHVSLFLLLSFQTKNKNWPHTNVLLDIINNNKKQQQKLNTKNNKGCWVLLHFLITKFGICSLLVGFVTDVLAIYLWCFQHISLGAIVLLIHTYMRTYTYRHNTHIMYTCTHTHTQDTHLYAYIYTHVGLAEWSSVWTDHPLWCCHLCLYWFVSINLSLYILFRNTYTLRIDHVSCIYNRMYACQLHI